MKLSRAFIKMFVGILGVFLLLTGVEYAFGVFDVLEDNRSETLQTGTWTAGTPIYTAQEFYDFATSSTSSTTDHYYLANDIDFTGFTWNYDPAFDTNQFQGAFSGNDFTLSNITMTTTGTSAKMMSLFSRINGATIRDVKIENYTMLVSTTFINTSNAQSAVFASEVTGTNNLFENIRMDNINLIATSLKGTAAVVAQVQANADITLKNIKIQNLTAISSSKRAGGLISRVLEGTGVVLIEDVDVQGNISANNSISYTGGLIGTLQNVDCTVNRAIIEYTAEGTIALTDGSVTYKSNKHAGGFIGNNRSVNFTLTDAFYTGILYTVYGNMGSAIGREQQTPTMVNTYYSNVLFNDTYVAPTTTTGLHGTLVNESSMPNVAWWNGFAVNFFTVNSLWLQDGTGRLYLEE